MENRISNSTFGFQLLRKKSLSFLITFFALLSFAQLANAQKVPANCPGNSALYSITFEDASTKTSTDAKIRLSGALGANDRFGVSTGTTYAGPSFSSAAKYSTITNGYLPGPFSNPATSAGQPYVVRVFTADTTCYVDLAVTQPYVNFSTVPLYPDINVTATSTPTTGLAVGSTVTVTITVKNEGDTTATNVNEAISIPSSLTYLSGTPDAGTTWTQGTGVWNVGTLTKGQSKNLVLSVKIAQEGVSFISANTTTENDPYGTSIDKDSAPGPTPAGEDDEASVCISTPFTYCSLDQYKIVLPNYFTNFKWTFTPTGGTAFDISSPGTQSGVTMNADKSLTVATTGTISYSYTIGTCTVSACCPITVVPGTVPKLVQPTIPSSNICSTSTFSPITVNLQNPTDPDLTGSQVSYQWYKVVGTTPTAVVGQTTNTLSSFPSGAGTYTYRLVAWRGSHVNCKDSVSFTLTIYANPTGPALPATPYVVCQYGPSMTLMPSGATGTLKWYASATGTVATTTAPVITTSTPSTGSWWVTQTDANSCESARTEIPYTVNAAPATPGTAPLTYCQNQTAVALTATGITNTPNWYSSTGVSSTAPVPVTTAAGLQYFYVSQTDSKGCESLKGTITVTVKPQPVAAVLTMDATCSGVVAQTNAKIFLTRFRSDDKVTWNPGSTYNSATAQPTPPGSTPSTTAGSGMGLIVGTLANPTAATDSYTVRVTGSNGCTIDRIATINKKDCGCNATCEPATITKTN